VKKSGAWYTYEGEQLGKGRENAKQFLTENAEVMVEISEKIRTHMGIGDGETDLTEGEEELVDLDLDAPISLDD
jgi:recombination protein RecA